MSDLPPAPPPPPPPAPPPGWYPDPRGSGRAAWWDGNRWQPEPPTTNTERPLSTASPVAAFFSAVVDSKTKRVVLLAIVGLMILIAINQSGVLHNFNESYKLGRDVAREGAVQKFIESGMSPWGACETALQAEVTFRHGTDEFDFDDAMEGCQDVFGSR